MRFDRLRFGFACLVGGLAVYVACAMSADERFARPDAGFVDAVVDSIVMGPGDAIAGDAGSSGPTTVKGTCSKSATNAAGATFNYAELAFAGKTKEQLSRAGVLVCMPTSKARPADYECTSTPLAVWVRDGSLLVQCDPTTTASVSATVD